MTSLFFPIERLQKKYRADVNRLPGPASPDALRSVEDHLGVEFPDELRDFLARHHGASLLRGTINIRSTTDIAPASEDAPTVVLFADVEGQAWAFARDSGTSYAFGEWDGEALRPMHGSFSAWLNGTISICEARPTQLSDRISLRLAADPNDPYQALIAGEFALKQGDPDSAEAPLLIAASHPATAAVAWQRLGDVRTASDAEAAMKAWQKAFHITTLPLPYPGAPTVDAELFRSLTHCFPDPEELERELTKFMDDQVADVTSGVEAALFVTAGQRRGRSALQRGARSLARDHFADLLGRCRMMRHSHVPWDTVLLLAEVEADLGNHDEAEAYVRRIRREGPAQLNNNARLVLGKIAITREEPWAEDILREAFHDAEAPLDAEHKAKAAALFAERMLRRNQLEDAQTWINRTESVSVPLAMPTLRATVSLLKGDLARAQKDLQVAKSHYEAAISQLDIRDDEELRLRLTSRLGDIQEAKGNLKGAYKLHRDAVEGFVRLELPVREAWALLRLARHVESPTGLLKAARQRFLEADLAAGIAALDSVTDDASGSLEWHLARATAHTRARHDARRSRPPWERADAERPERRLGAHRLAISACGPAIVDALASILDNAARAMATGRVRAVDVPVLQYVAAVDLLAGHRSWAAANVLLQHLVEQRVTGPARSALQAAVARSPNAALVDGLLRCVEKPDDHPASVVAEACEALGLRRERSSLKALVSLARQEANPVSRKAAIVALARIGDRRVVDEIIPALTDPVLEGPAALALLMLGDRRGVDFHARALTDNRTGLTVSPGEIVGRYGGPTHHLLLRTAARGQGEGAIGALQGLGLLGDPRAVPDLLEAIDHRDRRMVEVAAGALEIITGHREEMDEPGWKTKWNLWWEREGDSFDLGCRYRNGSVFTPHMLLERMSADDAWTRRTAHDELVITSGVNLPFDAEGPWRIQQMHLAAWRKWLQEEGHRMRPGRWYLDGQEVA